MCVISELSKNRRSEKLDLILHSPGGSLSAAEQIVNYLRKQYQFIRVIVPQNAMSAATMLACAADEILMGNHSALGPTDPQITLDGNVFAAQSIINEFNRAEEETQNDTGAYSLWVARIEQLPPGLLDDCDRTIKLSQEMVEEWLEKYMKLSAADAKHAAAKLADTNKHKTHDRPLSYDYLKGLKLNISRLEDNQPLQDAVLSVFHAATAAFENTGCFKIIENHLGMGIQESAA